MDTSTTPDQPTWLNPAVLKWAREWRGRSVEEAANHLGKSDRQILAWEHGNGTPTVKQARKLVAFYDRPFLELFLPAVPEVARPSTIPDFRTRRKIQAPADNWKLQETLGWAETQRINALDLYGELGETPPSFPDHLFSARDEDPDQVATNVREVLGFSIQDQMQMTKTRARSLPTLLRELIELIGVLTLRTPVLSELNVRGVCLAVFPLPVIVFSSEASTAQSFTLMHELGHVLLKESGVTGKRSRHDLDVPVERWCDHFAASFLMPSDQVAAVAGERPHQSAASFGDRDLAHLSDIFRVSPHAMLIRLVQLGYVDEAFYWGVKKAQFEREEERATSHARSSYYGSRYRASHGDLYTRLVLDAWAEDRITNHNAAECLEIKNIAHLNSVRDHFDLPL